MPVSSTRRSPTWIAGPGSGWWPWSTTYRCGTGGCTLAGEVAQLWGSITLPASRGRGSYRAVLAERLRLAREHGATLALVKGRVLSSGPILLRAGFADYGEERCYWLPVS